MRTRALGGGGRGGGGGEGGGGKGGRLRSKKKRKKKKKVITRHTHTHTHTRRHDKAKKSPGRTINQGRFAQAAVYISTINLRSCFIHNGDVYHNQNSGSVQ